MYLKQYQDGLIKRFVADMKCNNLTIVNGYPVAALKVPTGGGKTIIAGCFIGEYMKFNHINKGLIVWLVPTDAIYEQTLKQLRESSSPLRQRLSVQAGFMIRVFGKGDRITDSDVNDGLCILVLIDKSVKRNGQKSNTDYLHFHRENSAYSDSFYDFDTASTKDISSYRQANPMLEYDTDGYPVRSFYNFVVLHNPIIVTDEAHKMSSSLSLTMINELNPRILFQLSATPNNVLVAPQYEVGGDELHREHMIKLPINCEYISSDNMKVDFRILIDRALGRLNKLDLAAKNELPRYVRPIVLIRVDLITEELKAKNPDKTFPSDVIDYLVNVRKVNRDEIAIKTSEINELSNNDLLDSECPIRFIITRDALKEGWDCSFAYILVNLVTAASDVKESTIQLVGRVLRQPHAKLFNSPELNESYVFYNDAGKNGMLYQDIENELKANQGYNNLTGFVKNKSSNTSNIVQRKQSASIKPLMKLLLPKVLAGEREIDFHKDILPTIDWKLFPAWLGQKSAALTTLSRLSKTNIVNTNGLRIGGNSASNNVVTTVRHQYSEYEVVSRLAEIIPNPFIAKRTWEALSSIRLANHIVAYSDVLDYMLTLIEEFVFEQAKRTFTTNVGNGTFSYKLVVKEEAHWKLPSCFEHLDNWSDAANSKCLFTEHENLNHEEQRWVNTFATTANIIDWYKFAAKNAASYYIKGWRREPAVYPDFLVITDKGVVLLESKGSHLMNSDDTKYKEELFSVLNSVNPTGLLNGSEAVINLRLETTAVQNIQNVATW